METPNLTQRQIDTLNYLVYKELVSDNNLVGKGELREILERLSKCESNTERVKSPITEKVTSPFEGDTKLYTNEEGTVYFDPDPHPESVFYI